MRFNKERSPQGLSQMHGQRTKYICRKDTQRRTVLRVRHVERDTAL